MVVVVEKPKALTDAVFHYCPGCTHGIIHRLVAEAIDTLGIEGRTIGIAPVGCSVLAYDYFTCDMVEASHGRAPAVATGVKRSLPDNIVFTYQGDGDLASIGLSRDRLRRGARRKYHGHLCQQRDLWHDGRPDGPDLSARPDHTDVALWTRR